MARVLGFPANAFAVSKRNAIAARSLPHLYVRTMHSRITTRAMLDGPSAPYGFVRKSIGGSKKAKVARTGQDSNRPLSRRSYAKGERKDENEGATGGSGTGITTKETLGPEGDGASSSGVVSIRSLRMLVFKPPYPELLCRCRWKPVPRSTYRKKL